MPQYPTSFPAALDNIAKIALGPSVNVPNPGGYTHDAVHDFLLQALAAMQTKMGAAGSADATSLDYKARVEQVCGMLEAPTAKTYVLMQSSKIAYTLNEITIASLSGTLTVAIQINGVSVTGLSAIAVTSTPQTVTATAANTINPGDKVTMVVSSIATPVDCSFTVKLSK